MKTIYWFLVFTQSKLDKQWWWDDGGAGGKDCEWKKRKSYHNRHHKLGLWLFNCFLSFAVDLLKLSYCKMCLTISISVTLYNRDFLFVLISSHVEKKFEMIESKFLFSGHLNTNKNNTHFKTCFKLSSRLVFFWANSDYKEMSGTHSSNSSCRPLSCSFAWNQDFAAIFSSSTKRTEITQSRPQGFSVFLSFLAMLLYFTYIANFFLRPH